MDDVLLHIITLHYISDPGGLVVRIRRSHRRGRGLIPRLGNIGYFVSGYLHIITANHLVRWG